MHHTQDQTKQIAKRAFRQIFPNANFRFHNEWGGSFSENGWPDWLVLVNTAEIFKIEDGVNHFNGNKIYRFRFELKRNWRDNKSKNFKIQQRNIRDLRQYGYITGWLCGDEYKAEWGDEPIKLKDFLERLK